MGLFSISQQQIARTAMNIAHNTWDYSKPIVAGALAIALFSPSENPAPSFTPVVQVNELSIPFFRDQSQACLPSEKLLDQTIITAQRATPLATSSINRKFNELQFLLKSNFLNFLGRGNNPNPAVFFQAEELEITPYHPAIGKAFPVARNQFMLDHPKLFTGTVKSVKDMCHKFSLAKKRFGQKIKEVYIRAHGSPVGMFFLKHLGEFWTVNTNIPNGCFKDHIAKDATIILESCATAGDASLYGVENFAQRISRLVPEGRVIAPKLPLFSLSTSYRLNPNNQSHIDFSGGFFGSSSNKDITMIIENSKSDCRVTRG